MRPEFRRLEGDILEASRRLDLMEGSLVGVVESILAKFKEEMVDSVGFVVAEFNKNNDGAGSRRAEKGTDTRSLENRNGEDANVTPLPVGNDDAVDYGDNHSPEKNNGVYDKAVGETINNSFAQSAHSQNNAFAIDNLNQRPCMDMPSFSLGLTQEEHLKGGEGISPMESMGLVRRCTINEVDYNEDAPTYRKSKRQKCLPQGLVQDYECGREILARVRKAQKFIFAFAEKKEIDRKFAKLLQHVKCQVSLKVGGVEIRGQDILQVAERKKFPTSKIFLVIHSVNGSVESRETDQLSHGEILGLFPPKR
ncbi:unnamed protein product [Eruca vesicaria subsp. sativa]|uniref:Uncharacterized protein n=1 Tax=Eruca vesicaria subsp. sativa TaxID=29727 RepID=A0ABC8L1W6_ERUVS|nr:unnamed protein product [Eruca vesicaria subsp. sativa]